LKQKLYAKFSLLTNKPPNHQPLSKNLAEGAYRGDAKLTCDVISASIRVQDIEFINLESDDSKDKIGELAEKLKLQNSRNPNEFKKVYNAILTLVEKETRVKLKLIEVKVATPGLEYCTYYPVMLGLPLCLVVREANAITIAS
jgi:hypothetical protein